ncbi:MAG: 3-dehydroquinate synthase [Gemmatimonadaceae bacterium]|nr:3-dehydroquinate synthase [Gemmatimonadaceae bacterium]
MSVTTCRTLAYPIHVGHGLLDQLSVLVPEVASAHRVAVVSDDVVAPLYAGRIAAALGEDRSTLIAVPTGEEQKTRVTWARITDALLDARFGRDSLLIALGGGVVGDLTGFVAATYLRGIPVLQVPTTLLAMVDASIGGKTGVDTVHGKNLVGAFHPPVAVLADLDTLQTLPVLERINGMAEALKHGVICDADYFDQVAATDITRADWQAIVTRSVEIKTSVVAADEREHGLRKTLNFGHTIGHAVEQLMDYRVPHGACVAFGMLVETRIAVAMGLCDPSLEGRLQSAIERFGLPTGVPGILTPEAIVDATASDKKVRSGLVEYALPARCGAMAGAERGYGTPVGREVAVTALRQS